MSDSCQTAAGARSYDAPLTFHEALKMSTASPTAADKSAALFALHQRPGPFVIANAWDIASARMLEAAAYRVVDSSECDYGQVRKYLWSRLAPRVQALAQVTGREYPEWSGAATRAPGQSQATGYSAQIDNKY